MARRRGLTAALDRLGIGSGPASDSGVGAVSCLSRGFGCCSWRSCSRFLTRICSACSTFALDCNSASRVSALSPCVLTNYLDPCANPRAFWSPCVMPLSSLWRPPTSPPKGPCLPRCRPVSAPAAPKRAPSAPRRIVRCRLPSARLPSRKPFSPHRCRTRLPARSPTAMFRPGISPAMMIAASFARLSTGFCLMASNTSTATSP